MRGMPDRGGEFRIIGKSLSEAIVVTVLMIDDLRRLVLSWALFRIPFRSGTTSAIIMLNSKRKGVGIRVDLDKVNSKRKQG